METTSYHSIPVVTKCSFHDFSWRRANEKLEKVKFVILGSVFTPAVLFFSQAGLSSSPPVLLLHHLSRCRFLSMSKKSIFSILRAKMFHSSLCQSNKKPRDFEELLLPRMRATTIQSRYLKHTEENSKNTLTFFQIHKYLDQNVIVL